MGNSITIKVSSGIISIFCLLNINEYVHLGFHLDSNNYFTYVDTHIKVGHLLVTFLRIFLLGSIFVCFITHLSCPLCLSWINLVLLTFGAFANSTSNNPPLRLGCYCHNCIYSTYKKCSTLSTHVPCVIIFVINIRVSGALSCLHVEQK